MIILDILKNNGVQKVINQENLWDVLKHKWYTRKYKRQASPLPLGQPFLFVVKIIGQMLATLYHFATCTTPVT